MMTQPSRRAFAARTFRAAVTLALVATTPLATPNFSASPAGAAEFTQQDAHTALHKAVKFFREKIAVEGGYVYLVSEDLTKREGENKTTPTQVWIQPPATPSVGMAYLTAYQMTADERLLVAARETAECLIRGQFRSGGWYQYVEFNPKARGDYDYRVDPPAADGKLKKRRLTTLDDDKTQSCLTFLMRLDRELGFKDERLHEAVIYGLDALVKVQYPNGAWPQQFYEAPDPAAFPVLKASYPETWSRTFPAVNYAAHYTFNDDSIADVVGLMLEAGDTYDKPAYRAAAEKAGDFIIAAQMPEPQPAWAQQYDAAMHPVWARKFEPPSVTGGESQGVIQILLDLYAATGNDKYLAPVPAALAWLKRSALPDGQMARFYELGTNKPLYFTKKYELTYDDSDMPTHYGFKLGGKHEQLQKAYDKLKAEGPPERKVTSAPVERPVVKYSKKIAAPAAEVAGQLDERGAWVENGKLQDHGDDDPTTRVIATRTFIKNLLTLAKCAGAK
jgi:PelA/Pel-15E family pectate lyase